jgi:hypothetical protein
MKDKKMEWISTEPLKLIIATWQRFVKELEKMEVI